MSVSGLLFHESHYSCTALLFFLMPRCIHALYSPMFYIHSCVALDHASHSFMCFMCDSQAPDLSHRYMHSCVHSVSPSSHVSVTRHCALASFLFFPSCINYTALRPLPYSFSHSCITYTASCPLACFLSSSCIKSSIQQLIEEIRTDGYKTPNSHIVARFFV